MGAKSRTKGYAGEREVAKVFRDANRRWLSLQRNRSEMADGLVDGWLYVDSKFAERWKMTEWLEQVSACAPAGTVPAIAFRRSHGQWWIATPLADFAERMP